MSKAADNLPNLPETEVIQPILQCGVLYLGTALPTPGQRGLNSIQEPLSHRYPIDGTNTVRGDFSFYFSNKTSIIFIVTTLQELMRFFRSMKTEFNWFLLVKHMLHFSIRWRH